MMLHLEKQTYVKLLLFLKMFYDYNLSGIY